MKLNHILLSLTLALPTLAITPLVRTTTGPIIGSEVAPGVLAWKGIPFAAPPNGSRRWMLPELNKWSKTLNTTALGPACIQQFGENDGGIDLTQIFYNNPPLAEDEDCLTINIWAPSKPSEAPKAVLFWTFGGGFAFGGSGTYFYDGVSFAQDQDIILVSYNYRTNVFGFPNSPELPPQKQNLGLFDQQLALLWTKDNIAKFGGDPSKITIFGQSAGSGSTALLMERFPENPPFRGAILQSGVVDALDNSVSVPTGDFSVWNSMATHFGCPAANGTVQIDCLKKIPAQDLKQFINNNSLDFMPHADGGASMPDKPTEQLQTGGVSRIPVMIGDNAQGASSIVIGLDNFTAYISQPPYNAVPADALRALYPVPGKFATDAQAIIALETDFHYRCRSALFSDILVNNTRSTVYRYVFGALLAEFQVFPNAGTPEGVEMPYVFGNLNGTTNATEIALSKTLQTIWANFAKDPNRPPAPGWSAYMSKSKAIAALAFGDNVEIEHVVDLKNSSAIDGACQLLDTLQQ